MSELGHDSSLSGKMWRIRQQRAWKVGVGGGGQTSFSLETPSITGCEPMAVSIQYHRALEWLMALRLAHKLGGLRGNS